jgi:single-stranded-DNA-specific exonuclease
MAAGFTVTADHLIELRDFLEERAFAALGDGDSVPELSIDGIVSAGAANFELAELVARIGPFGTGNPEPRFLLPHTRVAHADVVGGAHLRLALADAGGAGRVKAMAFRALDSELGAALLASGGRAFHIVGHLRADRWQGREAAQFLIDDAALAT